MPKHTRLVAHLEVHHPRNLDAFMQTEARPLKVGDKLLPYSFGVTGVDAWDYLETSTAKKRLGIVRNVQYDHDNSSVSGVRYVFESVKSDVGCKWRKAASPGVWEADLGTQRNPQSMKNYTSLANFSQQLRAKYQKTGRIEKSDDDLRLLDEFIQGILRIAGLLHSEKQLVGALTPDNAISFFDENATRRILLPDAGFRWQGAPPGPLWIKKLDSDWGELWLPQACDTFHSRDWSPAAEREDVVLLARMFLWVLTGSIENSDQIVRNEFARRVKETTAEVPAGCWATLYQTIATEEELKALGLPPIRTVTELADRLKVSPLSEHFLYFRPKRKGWLSWKPIVPALLMFGLLGGVGYLAINPEFTRKLISCIIREPPPRNRLCPECAHPSAFLPILDEMLPIVDTLQSRLDAGTAADVQLYDKFLWERLDKLDALETLLAKLRAAGETSLGDMQQEQACLEKIQLQYAEMLDSLGKSFYASAQNGNVVDQQGIGRKLVEVFDQWSVKNVTANPEKPEWYQMTRTYFLD